MRLYIGQHLAQLGDRLVLEQQLRREPQPPLRRSRHHLDAPDRVCAGTTPSPVPPSPRSAARVTTWMLRIESPPSSKKLSCTPTRSTRSTSPHTSASALSTSSRGDPYARSSHSASGRT